MEIDSRFASGLPPGWCVPPGGRRLLTSMDAFAINSKEAPSSPSTSLRPPLPPVGRATREVRGYLAHKTPPLQDPTVGLCLGSRRGPRGWDVSSYGRGIPVRRDDGSRVETGDKSLRAVARVDTGEVIHHNPQTISETPHSPRKNRKRANPPRCASRLVTSRASRWATRCALWRATPRCFSPSRAQMSPGLTCPISLSEPVLGVRECVQVHI